MLNLRERVQSALLDDKHTREAGIEVLNENGVITLSGMVPDREISDSAKAIAEDVDGVVAVINEIEVKKDDDSDLDFKGTLDADVVVNE